VTGSAIFQVLPPPLTVRFTSGNEVEITWPAISPEFVLETCEDLGSGSWTAVTQFPIRANGRNKLTLSAPTSNHFFRLKKNRARAGPQTFFLSGKRAGLGGNPVCASRPARGSEMPGVERSRNSRNRNEAAETKKTITMKRSSILHIAALACLACAAPSVAAIHYVNVNNAKATSPPGRLRQM